MRVIDIGIPKTGTVYREATIKGMHERKHYIVEGEKPAEYFTKLRLKKDDFVFAFVRNPFDLLVSHYEFIKRPDVQTHHPDKKLASLTFDQFVRVLVKREKGYPNKNPLFFQVYRAGQVFPDMICKYEDMDNEIEKICDITGCSYEKQPPLNTSEHDGYKGYYTEELVKLVEKTWRTDLDFGYTFDG